MIYKIVRDNEKKERVVDFFSGKSVSKEEEMMVLNTVNRERKRAKQGGKRWKKEVFLEQV